MCARRLVLWLSLLCLTGIANAQTYLYRIADPMVGTSAADLNVEFWQPYLAHPSGGVQVTSGGVVFTGWQGYLGYQPPTAWWLLKGDFRITMYVKNDVADRWGITLVEATQSCAGFGGNPAVVGLWGGSSYAPNPNSYYVPQGAGAYYLFKKSGNQITIRQGSASAVGDLDPVVQSLTVNAASEFAFYMGNGNPSSGQFTTRDLVVQTQDIVSCRTAHPVSVWTIDTVPNAFSLSAQTGVNPNASATSNTITVAGINAPTPVSVTGGMYSVNGGAYTAATGTVNNGDTVTVRQTASASFSTTTTTTLTIGGVSADYLVTTRSAPATSYTAASATGSGSVVASFTGGGALCGYAARELIGVTGNPASPPSGSAPTGVTFPHGLFAFTANGCTEGSTLNFSITYPQALPAGTVYWKYGPTSSNPTAHWYQIPALINGNTVTFSIVDGGLGDDDLMANGVINDAGGPGFSAAAGVTSVPTISEWGMILLVMLLTWAAWFGVRRRP